MSCADGCRPLPVLKHARAVGLLVAMLLGGCGGAVQSDVTAQGSAAPAVAPAISPADVPVPSPVPPVTSPVPSPPVPAPEPPLPPIADPLAGWFLGGFANKTLVVWGNSTVSNAIYFFDQLRLQTAQGGALAGLNPSRILNYGNNGASLAALLGGMGPYPIGSVIAAHPDLLLIRGPLINDVRLGGTTLDQARQLLASAIEQIRAGSPQTAILLTTENSLLTSDAYGYGWVQPNSAAQAYTDILHDAVMAMEGRYSNVRVHDIMSLEYGVTSTAASRLMADQLHPNDVGQRMEADLIVAVIGKGAADAL